MKWLPLCLTHMKSSTIYYYYCVQKDGDVNWFEKPALGLIVAVGLKKCFYNDSLPLSLNPPHLYSHKDILPALIVQ